MARGIRVPGKIRGAPNSEKIPPPPTPLSPFRGGGKFFSVSKGESENHRTLPAYRRASLKLSASAAHFPAMS